VTDMAMDVLFRFHIQSIHQLVDWSGGIFPADKLVL
jgi:hypothetical protein